MTDAHNVGQDATLIAAAVVIARLSSIRPLNTSSFFLTLGSAGLLVGTDLLGPCVSSVRLQVAVGSVLVGSRETAAPALDTELLKPIPPRVGV